MHVVNSIVETKQDYGAEIPSGCRYRMFISTYEPSSYVYAKLVLFESTRALPECGKALVPSNRRPYTKEKREKRKN